MKVVSEQILHVPSLILPEIVLPAVTKVISLSDAFSLRRLQQQAGQPARFVLSANQKQLPDTICCLVETECLNNSQTLTKRIRVTGLRRVKIIQAVSKDAWIVKTVNDCFGVIKGDLLEYRGVILKQLRQLAGSLSQRLLVSALETEIPLGKLCDLIAGGMNLPVAEQREVLGELDIARRSQFIQRHLSELLLAAARKPLDGMPEFSLN